MINIVIKKHKWYFLLGIQMPYIFINLCVWVCMYVCMCGCVWVCVCIYLCVCVCLYSFVNNETFVFGTVLPKSGTVENTLFFPHFPFYRWWKSVVMMENFNPCLFYLVVHETTSRWDLVGQDENRLSQTKGNCLCWHQCVYWWPSWILMWQHIFFYIEFSYMSRCSHTPVSTSFIFLVI